MKKGDENPMKWILKACSEPSSMADEIARKLIYGDRSRGSKAAEDKNKK
jgi:hypothetical protein